MFLTENLFKTLNNISPQHRYLIGYSGGLDSHVLLVAMHELAKKNPDWRIRAVHINHYLSSNANHWENHCAAVCQHLNIDLVIKKIASEPIKGESVEAWARTLRYEIFGELLQENEVLLTAHTQDDQAETLLLQLIRGAGVKGLAAMPIKKIMPEKLHVRPLLNITRADLHHFAKQKDLHWIEDESNNNLKFARNFIRHEIMPKLRELQPAVANNIARSAQHCAESSELLNELAHMDLQTIIPELTTKLPMTPLLKLNPSRQRNVLRYWLQQLNVQLPNSKHMEHLQKDLLQSVIDAKPCLRWQKWQLRRYQNHLYLLENTRLGKSKTKLPDKQFWNLQSPFALSDPFGHLLAERKLGAGIRTDIDCNKINVRFRQGGETFDISNRAGKHTLKKLFQEWKIPPWERAHTPLICYEDQLIQIPGYYFSPEFKAKENEQGFVINLNQNQIGFVIS